MVVEAGAVTSLAEQVASLRRAGADHVLGLRLNFFVAGTLTAAGLLSFWRIQRHDRHADQAAQPAPLASTTGSAT
jgi:hypothetical protein